MVRPPLVIAVITLLVIIPGGVVADDTAQRETFAEVVTGDLVIGEDRHRFGPMRAVGLDEDVEEAVVEIEVTELEKHGVDIGHAEVHLTDDDVQGASVVSSSVEDGVVSLVFAPDGSVFEVERFQLTGLDTEDAEAASDLTFDVSFSEGDAEGSRFDIVNPDEVTPTVTSDTLYTDFGEQQVTVEGIQPTDRTVTIKLDTTVLEAHGIAVDDLEAEVDTEGATVRKTTVESGIVTVVLAPGNDTVLFDARIGLSDFDTTTVDTEKRVVAADVTYGVRIEGNTNDSVDVEMFDLVSGGPTPAHEVERTPGERTQQNDETRPISEEGAGFGMVVTLIALVGSGLLVARRQ